MQNTSQTFRGPGAPGSNYDSYDNHLGAAHCQPSGYQSYSNPPYHPVPSSRPHHYGHHQMQQQNTPYRHHGGAYAPSQNNQYAPPQNINQDMYRNHYPGPPNPARNKPWPDSSPQEMMYGQASHPQMMNNMRSPPHATSNMNPAPGYRQSPVHSPHSWSQAQIPSPLHASRTTPSPLARSPGHSGPFSPPNINMPPPENGQPVENHNPTNPLHSLQKMVMLDQDPSKVMLPMLGEEQFANQCAFSPPEDAASNESKDSAYSTYYNMDENRFESKPNIATNDAFSTVQQVTNCNFPIPQHPMNSVEKSLLEALQPDHSLGTLGNELSAVPPPPVQCQPAVTQGDLVMNLGECPPHAESAPTFMDQTETVIATNSEQALETKLEPAVNTADLPVNSELPFADIPQPQNPGLPCSSESSASSFESSNASEVLPTAQIKTEEPESLKNCPQLHSLNEEKGCSNVVSNCETGGGSNNTKSSCPIKSDVTCKIELSDITEVLEEKILNSETIKLIAEVHKSDIDTEMDGGLANLKREESTADPMKAQKIEPDSENHTMDSKVDQSTLPTAEDSKLDSKNLPNKCDNSSGEFHDSKEDVEYNPVKVVIQRIRKDDTSDTWHVPGSGTMKGCQASNVTDCLEKKPESKIPTVGPQILIVSPTSSSQKKFGFQSSVAANNFITIDDEEISIIKTIESPSSRRNRSSSRLVATPDKKRGRPVGSKNKQSPVRKRKGRRGSKMKRQESTKPPDSTPKTTKKGKVFNGPYVHIVKSKGKQSSIKVVNVAQKEEEKVNNNKVLVKRNVATTASRLSKKPVGHLSTLSPTYDAFNKDKTWLCVFCHKGSHMGGLGDLYGPYYIKDKSPESAKQSPVASTSGTQRGKRRKSDVEDTKASKRAKHNASTHSSTPSSSRDDPSVASDLREVWLHEDCAVWCQAISLMAEEVHGLEEAVTEARENMCCKCSLNGATLGCWGKSCKEQYHYSCAKETGCQMDIENFSLLCPNHQKKSPRSSKQVPSNDNLQG